jgi:hypothetical protein
MENIAIYEVAEQGISQRRETESFVQARIEGHPAATVPTAMPARANTRPLVVGR